MKNSIYSLSSLTLIFCLFLFSACEKDNDFGNGTDPNGNQNPNNNPETEYALGYAGEDYLNTVPTSTNFGFGNGNLPSSVDLVPKFPPIGFQDNYGTCVAWAVGYNIKTAINGMSKGLSTAQLANTDNQFSPKDLFVAIPDNQKNPNCNGVNFNYALDVLQERGVASMSTVPYDYLGDCSQSNLQSSWTNEARNHKIKYWRKIEASTQSIKQNLANNIPVILGAKLADNFMSWNSNNVLSSGTGTANVGQHAYHAMVIAGYDDDKGQNGAFKVINSWGENWGDRGYIWIAYDYLINEFCVNSIGDQPLFIAANEDDTSPDNNNNNNNNNNSGKDVAPWVFADFSNYQNTGNPTSRRIDFNIYNIGDQNVAPSTGWSFHYIYFNPYDANDYGVVFNDNFNTSVSANTFECFASGCSFNYNIPAGGSFTQAVWGLSSVSKDYNIPPINGYYYLAMIADSYDEVSERDEINNIFYTSADPIYFQNGFGFASPDDSRNASNTFEFSNAAPFDLDQLARGKFNTIVNNDFKNAYTQEEILGFLKREYQNGNMQNKIEEAGNHQQNSAYNK